MSAVTVNNLRYRAGRLSLDIKELELREGVKTGIYAPKRGGKSTLMGFIAGFTDPDKGSIKVFGKSLEEDCSVRSCIAYINPYIGFVPTLKVSQVAKSFKSFYDNFDNELFDTLLSRFSIDKSKRLLMLNKAFSLKLSFALALSHHPKLILIDDLSADVDPFVVSAIMETVQPYFDNGATVIFTTARTGDLEKYADDAVIISDGKISRHIQLDSFTENSFILSGKSEKHYDEAIGYRISDGVCSFLVDSEDKMKRITEQDKLLIAGKPSKANVINYLVRGGSENE